MKKQLPANTWTKINTNSADYLIQNTSEYKIKIIVSDTIPDNSYDFDFILDTYHKINNNDVVGIIWGKPSGKVPVSVGIVEGI